MAQAHDLKANLQYVRGLMRGLLGAMVFALPLTMTVEMWDLGVTMDPARLALLLVMTVPLLIALSYYAGFEETFSLLDNILDAFAAMVLSAAACLVILLLFGAIDLQTPLTELVGKLTVLSFGASIGALLADKQFNDEREEGAQRQAARGFGSRLFVMGVGAIFLSLNIAPTDEVQLIAGSIGPPYAVVLACVSLFALGIVLSLADPGTANASWACRARRAFAGYGLCLVIAGFILWCFGRLDGVAFNEAVETVIVLGFPASLGAGAARLILGGEGDKEE